MKVKDKTRVIQVEVKGKTSGSQGQNKGNSRVNQEKSSEKQGEARKIKGKSDPDEKGS